MVIPLGSVVSLVKLSTGRRLSIYNQLRPVAQARDLTDLVTHIDGAAAHDRYTQELENQWAARPERVIYAREVARLDGLVDRTVTSVRDIARSQAEGLPDDDPVVVASTRLQEVVFPAGVFAITNLPFVDEVAAVEVVVQQLATLGPEVALLGLTARVARLAELTAAYRAAVDAYPEPLEYATVRAGQQRGQSLLLEITARIVGTFYAEDREDHAEARGELLAPIVTQAEIVRANNRARRRAGGAPDADDNIDDGDIGDEFGGAPGGDVAPAGDAAVSSPAAGSGAIGDRLLARYGI